MSNNQIINVDQIIRINRPHANIIPDLLPMPWDEMSNTEKRIALFYIQRLGGSFERSNIARHLIGLMIIEAEKSIDDAEKRNAHIEEKTMRIWNMIHLPEA
jgi:hypothetical protein